VLRIRAYGFSFGRLVCRNVAAGRKREGRKGKGGRDVEGFLHPKGRYGHVVSSGVCFPCVSSGIMMKEGETHME